MKISFIYIVLLVFPFFGWSQLKPMGESQRRSFEQSLQHMVQLKTLEADFVQYKHMSFMQKPIVSKGKLYLKENNLLRWSYLTPFVYDMVFKNNKIQINDQGNKRTIDV